MNADSAEVQEVYGLLKKAGAEVDPPLTNIGSAVYANKPGDGSAREQAASCQRVLGGAANFAKEYATKRYRSNCINWGILPFLVNEGDSFSEGTWVLVKDIRHALESETDIEAYTVKNGKAEKTVLKLGILTKEEEEILKDGCLINYYKH